MPVGAYTGPDVSTANGVATIFPYNFRILEETDLVVEVDEAPQTLGVDYTVDGVNDPNGGNVTFTTAPANGALVVRHRVRPYERDTDYQRNGSFDEETVDKDLDSLQMQIQQFEALAKRAPKAPKSVGTDQVVTQEEWNDRAGRVWGFDALGTLRLLVGQAGTSLVDLASSMGASLIGFIQSGNKTIVRTLQDKGRDTRSLFDFLTDAQKADVRARTSLVDLTVRWNDALAEAASNNFDIYLPPGKYHIDDTLWITPDNSVFKSARMFGAGGGYADGIAQTVIDASSIQTKPAINIFMARGVELEDFFLLGGNKEIETQIALDDLLYNAAYVSAGFRDSQYSPHCGIIIDAGVGSTPPDGGYPGFTYRALGGGTARVNLRNVVIRRFVVGFGHNLESANASQGDEVLLDNCHITNNKVCIAIGQSQARALTMLGGSVAWARTAFDGRTYGKQQGSDMMFVNTQFGAVFELFNHPSGFSPLKLMGCRAESVHRLGLADGGAITGLPTTLIGTDIHLHNKRAPIIFEAGSSGALQWIGGFLDDDSAAGPDSLFMLANPAVLQSVQVRLANRFRPYIGGLSDLNSPVTLKNCRVSDATGGLQYGEDTRRFAVSGRISEHWSLSLRRTRNALYDFVPMHQNNYVNIGTMSNIAFTDTTLTFDNTDAAGGIMVGDLIMWRFNAIGGSVQNFIGPGAKVTSVAAPTVTCSLLYHRSYYDEAHAPANTAVVVHEWAPGQALTGDTNSNNQLTNVSPTTILQNGDWITAAAGIPVNTRVLSGGGTATITLSRNATDTAAGKTLYGGRLHTFTTAAAF